MLPLLQILVQALHESLPAHHSGLSHIREQNAVLEALFFCSRYKRKSGEPRQLSAVAVLPEPRRCSVNFSSMLNCHASPQIASTFFKILSRASNRPSCRLSQTKPRGLPRDAFSSN